MQLVLERGGHSNVLLKQATEGGSTAFSPGGNAPRSEIKGSCRLTQGPKVAKLNRMDKTNG